MSRNHSKQNLLKRTANLEKEVAAKSYALKIESALEKVSIAAMSMRRSKDLSGIGSLIFKELKKLGFTDLRNTEIVINNDAKETITSYYYSDYGVTGVIELDYKSNAIVKGWADQLKKASNAFAEVVIPEKEMKAWRKYRDEIGYLPDPKLDKAKTVYYYSYSTGTGALSISSFQPVSKEQIKILKRFRNVFQLSYQRYRDIAKAESQAKEAEIELALERVRAKTMAMQKSEELQETTLVLFQQFKSLGVTAAQVSICVFDEDTRMGEMFVTLKGEKIDRSFEMELDKEIFVMKKAKKAFQDKQKKFSFTVKGKELQEYNYWRNSLIGRKGWDESNAVRKRSWHVDGAFFSRGMMGISSEMPASDEAIKLLERFAGVFDLTFTRFLDLQKAEAQAREAEIELALERVRARTLAMQKSDELPETTFLLFQQLKQLGETAAQLSIGIIKEEQGIVELSATIHGSQLLQSYAVPASDPYFMKKVIKPWKAKERFLTVEIRGKELIEYNKWRNSVLKRKIVFPEKQWIINVVFFSKGMISFSSDKHISHETIQLLERFAGVFDLTYTRFLDLQKAEAQAREAQIEAALERVRSRTMAMHRSDELAETAAHLFAQLNELGIRPYRFNIGIIDRENDRCQLWSTTNKGDVIPIGSFIPLTETPVLISLYDAWKNKQPRMVLKLAGEERVNFTNYISKFLPFAEYQPGNINLEQVSHEDAIFNHFFFKQGFFVIHTTAEVSEPDLNIARRFSNVFEQTYTRFLDLKQAEAQVRESQIQLALERVRARTMAMHKSEELAETAQVLFHQLQELGAIPARIAIGVLDEAEGVLNFWSTDQSGSHIDKSFKARLSEKKVMAKSYQAWKDHEKSLVIDLHGDDVKKWVQFTREEAGLVVQDEFIKDRRVHNFVFFSHGWILVTTDEPQSPETIKILERFASVFNLTYRRFLDLEKAEAQAREAQIEAALERVRSRSMAMHNSSELHDVIKVVTEQLSGLGIKFDHANFCKIDAAGNWDLWISTTEQAYPSQVHFPYFDHRVFNQLNDLENTTLDFFTDLYTAEEKNTFFGKFFETTEARNIPEERKQYVLNDKGMARSFFRLKNMWFSMGKYDDRLFTDEENNIFKRFAIVFEQSYIRFLDLQKAEAQARESQIETSLERVRSKTMAMHNSNDVGETVAAMFAEFVYLGIHTNRCGILIFNDQYVAEVWTARSTSGGIAKLIIGKLDLDAHKMLRSLYNAWNAKETFYQYNLLDDDLVQYYTAINNLKFYPTQFDLNALPSKEFHSDFFFADGAVFSFTNEPVVEEHAKIMKRFAGVFGQTYRRYLDLQKAEAQAREAQIEAGLERVRARTMAMFASDELAETAVVVYKQMNGLGIIPNRLYIVIINDDSGNMEFWITDENGDKIGSRHLVNVNKNISLKTMFDGWANNKKTIIIDQQANELQDWLSYWKENFHISFKDDNTIKRRVQTIAYFSKGFIAIASPDDQPQETIQVLERFAAVFNLTYTRFLDLQKAEAQAREAQIQLSLERVRAKAMAMHSSDDLNETIKVFYQQISLLSLKPRRCGVGLFNKENRMAEVSVMNTTEQGESIEAIGKMALEGHPVLEAIYEHWLSQQDYFPVLRGNQIKEYYQLLRPHLNYPDYPHDAVQYGYFFYFNEGTLYAWTTEALSEEELKIYRRFNSVLSLTYKRYKDLKQAEQNAREAQIEASLERVRSRTMAMHNSDDVGETVAAMFAEFVYLGIHTNRCGILIFNDQQIAEVWTARSTPGGNAKLIIGKLDLDAHKMLRSVYNAWKAKKSFYQYDLLDNDLVQYYTAINNSKFYPTQFDLNALPSKEFHSDFFFADGAVFSFTNEPVAEEHAKIIKRFALVFGQTYRRYLDLQKAEAQTRESQIQLSLERVRARAMAMHGSDELNELVKTLFEELIRLDVKLATCLISIFDISTLDETSWMFHPITREPYVKRIPYNEQPFYHEMLRAWKKRNAAWNYCLEGETKAKWHSFLFTDTEFAVLPQAVIDEMRRPDKVFFTASYYSYGAIQAASLEPFPVQSIDIIQRFSKVFDLSYTRFLDLQKAEAQAREAQIQLSLERVRARTMAMHKSEELPEVAEVLYNQLKDLGDDPERITIGIMSEDNRVITWWATDQGGSKLNIRFQATADEPTVMLKLYNSWKAKHTSLVVDLTGPELSQWVKYCREVIGVPINEEILQNRRVQTAGFFSHGCVMITSPDLPDAETINILERFTTVFDLTFRRFLDLQKAEAQTREAQIEAGLERVRARTMAMHSSEDVSLATATMFTELEKSGIENFRGGITNILTNRTQDVWSVNNLAEARPAINSITGDNETVGRGTVLKAVGAFNIDAHPFWRLMFKEWEAKKDFLHYFLAGQEKEEYIKILNATQGYLSKAIEQFPDVHFQVYFFNEGAVWTNSLHPHSEEDKQVMKRFASVFSLTFRRYQDLKKAEAQAREATIEAALEKVRGKAMAMHNSNDLSATASMVFTELRKLGISPIRCGVGLLSNDSLKAPLYSATSSADGDSLSLVGWVLLSGHPTLEKIYESWLKNEDYYPELSGEQLRSYYEHLLSGLSLPSVPAWDNGQKQFGTFLPFSVGCLYAWSEAAYNETEIKILKRFATIIDLTFRRYMELQTSEANAREAVKQAALDRIRADIASMRTVADLDRITPLIWNELTILGLPFIRCGVFIMDNSQQLIHTFLSTPDGKAIGAFHLPYDTPGNFSTMLKYWLDKKIYTGRWTEIDFRDIAEILLNQGAIATKEQYLSTLPKDGFYLHFVPFLQGMLYVGNTTQLGEEEIELIQHVADAFSTAYARYEDFNKLEAAKQQVEKTLTDLKQAQTLLVQSEKMASLGELTAGIAHEIQNPLNFVNNFSEVSNELLEEMKMELEKGNNEDALAIAKDVKQNLEKINHHGKRADGIVKGMLQHSRTSSGQKEMTDINVLADEYLRLAYHGLRAKDKSFNAKFETCFDKNVGEINIIPQDIGRVILNLINNAFYAVSEKKKQKQAGYEPTVTLTTVKDNGKIGIKVKDNGNGITQKVLDKIFQPFFTTKPTGQGTGLGLSLAYDIVKAHGGELKVETKEGEGSEFVIQLPII